MNEFRVSPKNLLLGLFYTGDSEAIPVRAITGIGELFGFTSNAMRVNVARLLSAGILTQDARGHYLLNQKNISAKTHLISRLLGRWHEGEQRRRAWDGSWLMACLPNRKSETNDKDNIKALSFLGFGTLNAHQWVRPNNLRDARQDLAEHLSLLGITSEAQLFVVSEADSRLVRAWQEEIWPIEVYQKNYEILFQELQASKDRLQGMSQGQAAVETFSLGSRVVNTLTMDPYLPEEMMSCDKRVRLAEAMREYDAIGKDVWSRALSELDASELSMPLPVSLAH